MRVTDWLVSMRCDWLRLEDVVVGDVRGVNLSTHSDSFVACVQSAIGLGVALLARLEPGPR